MKILTPFRAVTIAAALLAALSTSLGVALASGTSRSGAADDTNPYVGVFDGDHNSPACVHSPYLLQRNEHNVIQFYTVAFNDKNPQLAVKLYGGSEYIQHNPLAANGFPAFIDFVTSFTTAFPTIHIDIRRVFADCDFVVTQSIASGPAEIYGPQGSKVVDIFRLDVRGKVVEHWDVQAQLSPTSANGNPEV
ncbi:MAG: ester cyclase [Actinobacteria bacterium]|nr:ester cyclase [Actinomycetota bacterium]